MATDKTRISELPLVGALTGNETVPVLQGGVTKRTLLSIIRTWLKTYFDTIYAAIADLTELDHRIDNLESVTSSLILYLDNSASDISGYEQLLRTPTTTTLVEETIAINNNTVIFDSYATIAGFPGSTTIPAGIWTMHGHFQFSAVTGDNYIHWDVYKRTSGGTETLLFRMSSADIAVTTEQEILLQEVQSAVVLAIGDRLVVKLYAQTTGAAKNATFRYSSDAKFAFIQPPAFTVLLAVATDGTTITGNGMAETPLKALKAQQTLTSSASIAMNINLGQNAYISLGHSATLTISNLVAGNEGNIVIDNTGSYTLTISPTPYVINDGAGDIALAASSRTILSYYYDGTALNITKGENYTNV